MRSRNFRLWTPPQMDAETWGMWVPWKVESLDGMTYQAYLRGRIRTMMEDEAPARIKDMVKRFLSLDMANGRGAEGVRPGLGERASEPDSRPDDRPRRDQRGERDRPGELAGERQPSDTDIAKNNRPNLFNSPYENGAIDAADNHLPSGVDLVNHNFGAERKRKKESKRNLLPNLAIRERKMGVARSTLKRAINLSLDSIGRSEIYRYSISNHDGYKLRVNSW